MKPMDNGNGQIDTTIEVVTPENIAFRYQVAGPFRRLLAYLIDLVIRVTAAWAVAMAIMLATAILGVPGLGWGATMVIVFVVVFFYGGVLEALWNGQTPGKRAVRIRVISIDGQPIDGTQAVLRNVLRAIDCQPVLLYQVGLVAAAANDRFQRLGDLASGTMVVVDEPNWFLGMMRVDEPAAIDLAGRLPAWFQPTRSMARALAAYVQRRRFFPLGRRQEIARHLGEPLTRRLGLAPGTDCDLLLCALYHRTFMTGHEEAPRAGSPFGPPRAAEAGDPFAPFSRLPGPEPVAGPVVIVKRAEASGVLKTSEVSGE